MGKITYTNKFNLPETLVRAVQLDTHVNTGTISVTTLIDSPQIRKLKEMHDYEVDVADSLYALMGTAIHHVLERAFISEYRKKAFITTAETLMIAAKEAEGTPQGQGMVQVADYLFKCIPALFPEIGNRYRFELNQTLHYGDDVISGTLDIYDTQEKILWDYKYCSVWSYIYPESRKKWDEQTNIYALMLIKNLGYDVQGIRVVAMFRDWSEFGKFKNANYPDRQTMEIPISLRSIDTIEARIQYHLNRHRAADAGQIPECTGQERWAEADEWAIKVPNGKRALKIVDTEALADEWIRANYHTRKERMFKEYRPGKSKRCESYCPVSHVCEQYAREKAATATKLSQNQQPTQ